MKLSLFEQAALNGTRFTSSRGDLTTEQVMRLSLPEVDGIAISIARTAQERSGESFLRSKDNATQQKSDFQLSVLKRIIAIKQHKEDEDLARQVRAAKRSKLLAALARREDADLEGKSRDELVAELEELEAG